MLIVAGHLTVAATQRDAYLAGCERVVEQARRIWCGLVATLRAPRAA